ncbi:VOC family protein [Maritalea mediterranea]|uniref:VOC family protein n=1 Tax=Maritalea mediterranea TaxID=2909667 RepID=A0ABS9EAJ8_9HYPH|nr:VOC family protein [Maritalea mediterranea]MCF4099872.1 VOC family protein [Maritalea mediterranea]
MLAQDVEASASFYTNILDLKRHFDSDWFIILTPKEGPVIELAILDANNPIVPDGMANKVTGGILNFVVEDVHVAHEAAQKIGAKIISPPTAMPYGQERMLIEDPNGQMIDVSSHTAPLQM